MADDEQLAILRDIARWTREAALPSARERVERILDTDPKKRLYQAMDGTKSFKALEKETGVNHNDARKLLGEWEAELIADPGTSPPKATFTLSELGIAPPPERVRRARKASP